MRQEDADEVEGAEVRAIMRTINSLPLNQPGDNSPYFGLEFDSSVINYCRDKSNLVEHQRKQQAASDGQGAPAKTKSTFRDEIKFEQKRQQQTKRPNYICMPSSVRNCKVVVSGDVSVGKTSLVNRFGRGLYSNTYRTTIGVDFDLQQYNILGQPYVLQIWDTAGLERFRCVTNSYYRGCQVALLVFDMSNMSTLANIFKWKDEVIAASKTHDQLASHLDKSTAHEFDSRQHCGDDSSGPLLFLVGTKCDLSISETGHTFIKEQANRIASVLQAELWLVSSRTGENVEHLFSRIAALSFNRCILNEIRRIKFEASTMGDCLKKKILQQQRELWSQSIKLIMITKRKDGDDRRSRCINIQCVVK